MNNKLLSMGNKLLDSYNFKLSEIIPSDYAEQNRVMTTDISAWPGPFSYDRNPYLKEIINCLSPDNSARIIAVQKGAQVGYTAGVIENGIAWIISEQPGPILFTCGDKELTKEVVEKRIEQAIDSCGIRHLIRSNTIKKSNKRTGDTTMNKEFAGGSLTSDGVNNTNKLRNRSMMYGFIDDFDAANVDTKKEGDFRSLLEMRFASYAFKMKLFYISTPTIKGQSNIENVFLLGDQRYYHVPCPECGELIILKWRIDSDFDKNVKAGIHFELNEKGKLIDNSVGYICQKCGKFFKETKKHEIISSGKWIPTTEPSEPGYLSYHISSLYSPPGMYSWVHYVRKWLEAYPNGLNEKANVNNLKSFINTCLGQTFEERGRSPKILRLAQNTRNYKINEVPVNLSVEDGNGKIVMLTCACDLNGKVDDARLDYEVIAISETGSTYSIDHGSIGTFQRSLSQENRELYTYRNNQPLNVWDVYLTEVLQKEYKGDDNKSYPIYASGIDTGNFTHYAYEFIDKHQHLENPLLICGLKGEGDKVRRINADTPIYRKSKERDNLYILEVNQIKDEIADRMELVWNEESELSQPSGFMNFPIPGENKYNIKTYFSQYEGEHKVAELNADGTEIGHKWQKRHSTSVNHFWDVAIYNRALRDIFIELFLKASKIKNITWGTYCELIKNI